MKPQIDNKKLDVVLVEPEIHWNTGNAGRSCLAAGAQLHLVEPLGFSLEAKQVKRAGLDYWKYVDPKIWSSWAEFEAQIDRMGDYYFISPDGEHSLWDVQFGPHTTLLLGKETQGFSKEIRRKYPSRLLSLPMHTQHVRSLNLSTTLGISLYEVIRQWGGNLAQRAIAESADSAT